MKMKMIPTSAPSITSKELTKPLKRSIMKFTNREKLIRSLR